MFVKVLSIDRGKSARSRTYWTRQPLSVVELNIALSLYLEVRTGKHSEPLDARVFSKWLERTCAFLGQEQNGEVSFIHQTVKEYLLKPKQSWL